MNTALGIKGGISLPSSPHAGKCGAGGGGVGTDFSSVTSSQKISGTAMRSPVISRLSPEGGKHPGVEEGELDWLAEESAKKRKALLKELRD